MEIRSAPDSSTTFSVAAKMLSMVCSERRLLRRRRGDVAAAAGAAAGAGDTAGAACTAGARLLRAFGAGATDCAALLLLFSATARFFAGCLAAIVDVPV